MCLAIPMQLIERERFQGTAELDGVRRSVGLMLCPEALPGDYVLVHAGYAIGTIDEVEAKRTLALIAEVMGAEVMGAEVMGAEALGSEVPGAEVTGEEAAQ